MNILKDLKVMPGPRENEHSVMSRPGVCKLCIYRAFPWLTLGHVVRGTPEQLRALR